METNGNVSVLITTYNWPEALLLSLRSVFAQTILPKEIVIADDGSRDETRELITSLKNEVPENVEMIHVWHEDLGFRLAGIRNKALSKITSDYVVQIDGDCIMERHFIEDHLQLAKPGCFIAGSRVFVSKEDTERILENKIFKPSDLNLSISHRLNSKRNKFLRNFIAPRYKKNNIWAARGANMSYYMDDIVSVNGYNEEFVGWGFEDSELAFRLYNMGIKHLALKFGGVLYHLHHNERSRTHADRLKQMALMSYHQGIKRTDVGLDSCWER